MTSSMSPLEMASLAANVADDRKAKDILLLNTEQVSNLADYFVIASVDSRPQMVALADHLLKTFKQNDLIPLGQELDKGGRWTLIDFGDIVIHLFDSEDRDYYSLERFWNHATEIPRSQWAKPIKQVS